jgi:hypothetical protein
MNILKVILPLCLLLPSVVTIDPALAEKPYTIYGRKGTYSVNLGAATYRGCLKKGGCVSLGRKSFLGCNDACSWRNGQYVYTVSHIDLSVVVSKNGRQIFQDGQ